MKRLILCAVISSALVGCGDEPEPKTEQQIQFEQQKEIMRMQMQHEREMAKIQKGSGTVTISSGMPTVTNEPQPITQERPVYEHNYEQPAPSYVQQPQQTSVGAPAPYYDQQQPITGNISGGQSDSGSSVLGTVGAVAAGALVGYAASELLDNGMRRYTGSDGRTVYVGKDGKEISKSAYENYRKQNPVKSKIADRNQQAKSAIRTGADKTTEVTKKGYENAKQASKKAATSTKNAAGKASQSIRQSASKARQSVKSHSSNSSSKRK